MNNKKKVVVPNDNTITLAAALERHNTLDTGHLFALVNPHGHYESFQAKLKKLTTTPDEDGQKYIYRPRIDLPFDPARERFPKQRQAIYELTDEGRLLLGSRANRFQPKDTTKIVHRYMTGSLTAQIELSCRARGFTYLSFEDIARDDRCKYPTMSLTTDDGEIVPDAVCGIRYGPGVARFFAIESERYSKTITKDGLSRAAYGKKIPRYRDALRTKAYRKWGIPNLRVLTYADSFDRMQQMIDVANDQDFLFTYNPRFGKNWTTCPMEYAETSGGNKKPLAPIIDDIFFEPLYRKGGRFDISRP